MGFHLPLEINAIHLHLAREIQTCAHDLYPKLKKRDSLLESKAKLISSLQSMEKHTLSLAVIRRALLGKDIKLDAIEIQQLRNTIMVCDLIKKWDPCSLQHFTQAHGLLMRNLCSRNGLWRNRQVVVREGKHITHIPPKPSQVSLLMRQLFQDIRREKHIPWLIKACVFHYGIQYIHPFTDGNGRIGRLWQHLLTLKANPIFQYVLISRIIQKHEIGYYHALDNSDIKKDGGIFIAFCLKHILNTLESL